MIHDFVGPLHHFFATGGILTGQRNYYMSSGKERRHQ